MVRKKYYYQFLEPFAIRAAQQNIWVRESYIYGRVSDKNFNMASEEVLQSTPVSRDPRMSTHAQNTENPHTAAKLQL